ncbi:hypothetical protein LTS18_009921, partial [Coniosporium uncinatum]
MSKAGTRASTTYKKKDGFLVVSKDKRTVVWTPATPPGAPPFLTIPVANIQNLQQTPTTSPKVSLRIVAGRPGAPDPDSHVFAFTAPNAARDEQATITAEIKNAIESHKAQEAASAVVLDRTSNDTPGADTAQSAAMAMAKAVSGRTKDDDGVFDDAQLLADMNLQQSLLSSNATLNARFKQSLAERPDTITLTQFTAQFWSTRLHLLRAHAVEKAQNPGQYNVLSEVKPQNKDGVTSLNLSKEQIHLIFTQHPLVKKIYDDLVPKKSEGDFWGEFFQSILYHRMKGDKVDAGKYAPHKEFDKYLDYDEDAELRRQQALAHVPHFIDLEGNEQNHSQQQGNRADFTMRPQTIDKVPILRVLNAMSEKMLAQVAPTDAEAHAPVGMDEETFNELQLRDLARDDPDNRVMLSVRDQRRFFAGDKDKSVSSEAALYAKQNPSKVLSYLHKDLRFDAAAAAAPGQKRKTLNLETAIGVQDDSDDSDDEEANRKKKMRVGSSAGRRSATAHVLSSIRQRKIQSDDYSSPSGTFAVVPPSEAGLGEAVISALSMTHSTTVEFLHYFWNVFLSGEAERAGELQQLVKTLAKSLERIEAVAEQAERERQDYIDKYKRKLEEGFQRTGRRRKWDAEGVKGGGRAVNEMMAPTLRAINAARESYERAFKA